MMTSIAARASSGMLSSAVRAAAATTKSKDQLASVVVVVTGANRTGIVRDLCKKVFTPYNANIGRTRMATLGSDFGLLAHVTLPSNNVNEMTKGLADAFPSFVTGVSLQQQLQVAQQQEKLEQSKYKRISMIGPDDYGLLESLTIKISENDCNIQTLTSESRPAPQSGGDVFVADVTLSIPQDLPDAKLQEEILELGETLGVEMIIEDI